MAPGTGVSLERALDKSTPGKTPSHHTESPAKVSSVWLPIAFTLMFVVAGLPMLGWPVVAVIASGDLLALVWWTTRGRFSLAGPRMLPFHLAILAGLHFHIYEELTRGFAAAMRQTFHMNTFSDATFLNSIVFAVPIMYMLAAIGLWFRRPFAEFLTYTLFFGPGFMEWTHYLFPLLRPGAYSYFPGMHTAWVPMIPGLLAIGWNFRRLRRDRAQHFQKLQRTS